MPLVRYHGGPQSCKNIHPGNRHGFLFLETFWSTWPDVEKPWKSKIFNKNWN